MNSSENWEVEWLVAALAPWTVSPHPNFRDGEESEVARLALVTEMRDDDAGHEVPPRERSRWDWRARLVTDSRDSLFSDSQERSASSLIELSGVRSTPPGARAAAGIFGSVALCELEKHDEAVAALSRLVEDIGGPTAEPEGYSASQRLITAGVYMQLSTRLVESCKFEEARQRVEQTLRWLPTLKDSSWQEFPVSRGINWGSATVQRDLVRSVSSHALELKSHLEYFGGQTWVRVVRGRTSWVDMRRQIQSSSREEIVLRDVFERRVEADSNTRHFGRLTADTAGYRSLTLAEVSGHASYMRREREKLGKVLVLERDNDPERVREALRLLRQARATKALQSVITWIRAQGPSSALVDDARIIIHRATNARWCTEQDLLVLEGASDFLSPLHRDQAISAALIFADTPQVQGHINWSSWERLWKTLTRLVPDSSCHGEVADLAYEYLATSGLPSQPIANTLSRLVSALNWQVVAPETTRLWSLWAEQIGNEFDTRALRDAINEHVRGITRPVPVDLGVEKAAYLADGSLIADSTEEPVLELNNYLSALLREEVMQASRGVMSLGVYQRANVAVAFALRFPNAGLWDEIVDHLLDPKVDVALKDLAVGRLAENAAELPPTVATRLRDGINSLIRSKRQEARFAHSSPSVFGEAIRLSAALGAAPKADFLGTVLRLAASEVQDRIQAAKTIPFGISDGDATWGHALLLQLSHDLDPSVRASAGHALVRSLGASSELTEAVQVRIIDLLKSDGIKVPLATLHGVQRIARSDPGRLRPLVDHLNVLARSESNYVTKGAARICLEALRQSQ